MKLTKKFKDFLSGSLSGTPVVGNLGSLKKDDVKDIKAIILDFFKTNEKLADYVKFEEDYNGKPNVGFSRFSNLKLDYYKFKYDKDIVADLKERLSDVFVVNDANIYIGFWEHGMIEYTFELDISDTGLSSDQSIKSIRYAGSDDDVYFMNSSKFYMVSHMMVEGGDIEEYLKRDLVNYIRFLGVKWDFYFVSSEEFLKKIELEKRVNYLQSKIEDVRDILLDLIDLSYEDILSRIKLVVYQFF